MERDAMNPLRNFIVCAIFGAMAFSPLARAQTQNGQGSNSNPNLAFSGPVNVRGQIFLPDGDMPREPIRFEVTCSNGLHDLRYTDSGGRFILERLDPNLEYVITVESDEATWGVTRYHFHPGETDTVRFYLSNLTGKKDAKPATISAKSGYTPDPAAQDLHDRAVKAFNSGQADSAADLMNAAILKDPKYVIAYNDLGVILLRQKKYPDAEQILRKGLQQDPKIADLQANLGAALNHEDHFANAIAPLREALRLNPNLPDAHLQLGVSLVETDDLKPARDQLLEAQKELGEKAARNPILQMYLGELYARTGEFRQAVTAFQIYLTLEPDSPNTPAIKQLISKMQTEIAKN